MPPRKRYRNISGLRNQGKRRQDEPQPNPEPAPDVLHEGNESDDNEPQSTLTSGYGRRAFFRAIFVVDCGDDELDDEEMNDLEASESDSDDESEDAYDPDPDLDSTDVQTRLLQWAAEHNDDPRDEDWVPPSQKPRQRRKSARPKTYATGPDVSRKAKRTQRRYRSLIQGQTALEHYDFSASPSPIPSSSGQSLVSIPKSEPLNIELPPPSSPGSDADSQMRQSSVAIRQESVDIEIPPAIRQESIDVEIPLLIRQESVEVEIPPDPSGFGSPEDSVEIVVTETIRGGPEIRPWDVLREQIKDDLKKGASTLPLSQLNKLMILRNFATLRLKDTPSREASIEIARQWHDGPGTYFARRVRTLARYYQVFEQLPDEKRGGLRKSSSLLADERLQTTVNKLTWYALHLPAKVK